ncbi:alpha/beta fold hydrolase [Romboutsia sp. 13368]|uniref:alpha/beta fold hydrolase n=1 Tax=Romboutsia sp. 13368 TaxID=2708053 RepID=UPI0025F73956|nr:alpha/beta hydrolase [Romboutsia sp. 13368]
MEYIEGFANNKGVNIYYIDNGIKNSIKTPLLICPGLSECAKDYIKFMNKFDDRRCVALSFRGRGISDSPKGGYTLEDHIEDIKVVVEALELKQFCLLGVLRGLSYGLGYSILNLEKLKGLIINEYPAIHKEITNGWAEESRQIYNECDLVSISYEVLKSIEKDSKYVDFRNDLKKITCPTMILKGNLEDSLLRNDDIVDYINNLNSRSITIEKFDNAGHDIRIDDFEKLSKAIKKFLESLD